MSSRAIVMNSYGLVRYQKNVSIHLGRGVDAFSKNVQPSKTKNNLLRSSFSLQLQ